MTEDKDSSKLLTTSAAVYKKMTFWPHKTISGTFAFDKRGHFVKESCGKVDMMTSLLSMQNAVKMVMIMMMKIH